MAVVVCFVVVCVLSLYNVQYYLGTAKEHIDIRHTSSICQWHLMCWFVAFWGWCRCRFYGSKKITMFIFQLHRAVKYEILLVTYTDCIAHFVLCHSPPTTKLLLFHFTNMSQSLCFDVLGVFSCPHNMLCFPPSSVTTSTGTLSDFYFTLIALALLVWVSWAWTLLTFRAQQIYWQADVINH